MYYYFLELKSLHSSSNTHDIALLHRSRRRSSQPVTKIPNSPTSSFDSKPRYAHIVRTIAEFPIPMENIVRPNCHPHGRSHETMKRSSKLVGVSSNVRNLRSCKKIETNVDDKETVSKYFVAAISEPKNIVDKSKKRRSLEIKYDDGKRDKKDGNDVKWTPKNWRETLSNIREMRKHGTAPVDDMGCHTCADVNASPAESRYQCLVALMLSSQTKDQVTHAAMERLKIHGCSPKNIVETPDDVLGKLIYPVGFWKRKVEYLKKTATVLLKDYDGDIPKTIKGLCALPGVGPKMGHICMQVAWNETSGIGVDTHVHRISNRLGWVPKETKTPEATREGLESWLPKDLWSEVNHLLVGFGQEICLPRFPKCSECLNKNICPSAKESKKK